MQFDTNVQLQKPDTVTEELHIDCRFASQVMVLAINNCKRLTKLTVEVDLNRCQFQQLKVSQTCLKEFHIYRELDDWVPLITDIVGKSKDTLQSFKCNKGVDLTPLKDSKILRALQISRCPNYANVDTIKTFQNLQELSTDDERVISSLNPSEKLKTFGELNFRFKNGIKALPLSIANIRLDGKKTFKILKALFEEYPQIRDASLELQMRHEAAYLLDMFPHINFTFTHDYNRLFSLKHAYAFLHPEYQLNSKPTTVPDYRVYEMLFQRLSDKKQLFEPYFKAFSIKDPKGLLQYIADTPKRMLDQIQTFDEFLSCLDNICPDKKIGTFYFDKVFSLQLCDVEDEEYLRIIVSTYDEAFQIGANVEQTIIMLKAMTQEERSTIRKPFCFELWIYKEANFQII
ncbi:hypothetical protein FGO68_gene1316 [Halteria grandinella]|uniref:Uncharacterized protein n=1 Tax=Halteria grandinella TaxID=5974 RepID=A0A8J8NWY8_HALGN|nr:hypothetical protein FGO68_gene1316 [Halteria grandinella]